MLVNFRQGIVSTQNTPNFLTFVSGGVNINTGGAPTIITFAYGSHDYLFTEAEDIQPAWQGPFNVGTDYWLYWDLDIFTGLRTFGKTVTDPFPASQHNGMGRVLPSNPAVDQHWFDTSVYKYKVWTGSKWVEKIRVFAGKISGGAVLEPYSVGTQVGLSVQRRSGHLLFDSSGNAIRVADRLGRGYFVTTETLMNSQEDQTNAYKLESNQNVGKAIEPIPQYYCVCWKGPQELGLASYTDINNFCVGISAKVMGVDEVATFITDGFITNYNNWNFTDPPGTSLWVGPTGEITTDVPKVWSMQEIGHVVSPDTVFIDLYRQILIDPVPNPTPTPSATRTPTPTPSHTPTFTPTLTSTFTPQPTATLTPTPTSTQTLTPTMTGTVVATPSPTPTTSVTRTPNPTPTPTPSVTPSHAVGTFAIAQHNARGIGLLRHDGVNKTELAWTLDGGVTNPMDVRNISTDKTTIFAADNINSQVYAFLYDGTTALKRVGNISVPDAYDVKWDSVNNVLHTTVGAGVFLTAYQVSYDSNNFVTFSELGTLTNPDDFPNFGGATRAIYKFPDNKIFAVTGTSAYIAQYNTGTQDYTMLNLVDFSDDLTEGSNFYEFGWHVKSYLPSGTKCYMIVDAGTTTTTAFNPPNIVIYDTVDNSLTYMTNPIGNTLQQRFINQQSFASDGVDQLFVPNQNGTADIYTFNGTSFTQTDTLNTSDFKFLHFFYDTDGSIERVWPMQQFLPLIYQNFGGSYSNIVPTDDTFHTGLSDLSTPPLIDDAVFLKPMIQVTPTPSGA